MITSSGFVVRQTARITDWIYPTTPWRQSMVQMGEEVSMDQSRKRWPSRGLPSRSDANVLYPQHQRDAFDTCCIGGAGYEGSEP